MAEGRVRVRATCGVQIITNPHPNHSPRGRGSRLVDRWFYALKANPHPAILRALARGGLRVRVRLVRRGRGGARGAARAAGRAHPVHAELRAARGIRRRARAGVRVTLDSAAPAAALGRAVRRARHPPARRPRRRPRSPRQGAHRRRGVEVRRGRSTSSMSFVRSRAATTRASSACTRTWAPASSMSHTGVPCTRSSPASPKDFAGVESLDIGGGLGVPSRPDESPLDLAALGAALAEVKRAYPQFALWMEPGRYLVADAGVLLARVTQTKRKGAGQLRRRRRRHELADPPRAVRALARDREPDAPRRAGRRHGAGGRPDLRIAATCSAATVACPNAAKATCC